VAELRSSQRPVVVVTRAADQAEEFIAILSQKGAEVLHIPTIKLTSPDSWEACDNAIDDLSTFDWCIFSSGNGVEFFSDRLLSRCGSVERLKHLKIAAVGERTRTTAEERGLPVVLVPAEFSAAGLCEAFKGMEINGKRFLIVQPQEAGKRLSDFLTDEKATIHRVAAYKNISPDAAELKDFDLLIRRERVDVLTFTSPSTFRNFVRIIGEGDLQRWVEKGAAIASIGKTTTRAIEEAGFLVEIQPRLSTMPDFAQAIFAFLNQKSTYAS
jgi:uroporphyrinogen III methyltransferase/synthase